MSGFMAYNGDVNSLIPVYKEISKMKKVNIDEFYVLGISVKTTNKNGQSAKDIGELWQRFMIEKIIDKVPDRLDDNIYCLYTDYQGDYTEPYTVILGCKVNSHASAIEGMTLKKVNGGVFTKFTAKGNLSEGVVYNEWAKIWNISSARVYDTDFEVYGKNAMNPENAEVDIFVAFKE